MTSPYLSSGREAQALADVASTVVSRATARTLVALLLLTLVAVPVAEIAARVPHPALREVPTLRQLLATARAEGALAANRELLRSMQAIEDSLDRGSVLARYFLPWVQAGTTALLGAGNEQVIPGRGDQLFFVPDVEHVTGRPFLDPAVLRRRAVAGDERTVAPQPDPVLAINGLAEQLEARGIHLLLLPVPVKPMLHPELLTRRGAGAALPIENPSWEEFKARVARAGVELVDVAPALAAARRDGEPQLFLRTDTHWTPATMTKVAELLAAVVAPHLDAAPELVEWSRHETVVTGSGDLVKLLNLPPRQRQFEPQSVRVLRVEGPEGRPWASDRHAQVLLLGDSFANVFADADLGWGVGAGLAEQLSFHLRRPVERLADNGGGAHGARLRLAQDLDAGIDRLAGKRVVVYEFAMRYLTEGDWREAARASELR